MASKATKYFLLFFIIFFIAGVSYAQQPFRIESGISIKEKNADGKEQLIVGDVYYDKNIDKIIYDIKFPEKEKWVIKDTTLFKLVNDQITETFTIPPISRMTFFNLVLTGRINNYGLKDGGFEIEKVEKDKDLVITTYKPTPALEKYFGKILLSHKDKKLYGVIVINPEGQIVSKQFFRNYAVINGLIVPQEFIQITVLPDGTENKKITTFKNIKINNLQSANYDYNLTGK